MINLSAGKRKEVCEISVNRGDRTAELDAPEVLAVLNVPDPDTFKTRNIVIFRDTGYDAYSLYRIDPNLHYGSRNSGEATIAGLHLENKADFIKLGDRPALVLGSLDTAADITQNNDLWFSQPPLFEGTDQPSNYDNFGDAPSVFSPHYSYTLDDESWLIEKQEELQEKITYMRLEGADGFFPLPGFAERDANVLVDLKTRFYDRIPNNTLDIRVHPTFDSVYSFFTAYATGSLIGKGRINQIEINQDPGPILGNPWATPHALTEDKQFLRAVDVVAVAMRRAKTFGASKDSTDKKLAHPFHPPFVIEDYLTQTRFPNPLGFNVDSTSVVSDANMQIYYEEASKLILGDSFEELGKQISCAMAQFSAASITRAGPYTIGKQPGTNPNWAFGVYNHETISDELEDLIQASLGISIRENSDLAIIQDTFEDTPFGAADNRILRYSVQGFAIKTEEVKWYDLRFSNFTHTLTPAQDRKGLGEMVMLNMRQLRDLITLEGPTRNEGPNDFDDETQGVLSELGFDPDEFRSLFDEIYHAVGRSVDPYVLPLETLPSWQEEWDYVENNPFTIPRINFIDGPDGEVVESHLQARTKFKVYVHQLIDIGFFIPKIVSQAPLFYDLVETLNIGPEAIGSLADVQSDPDSFSSTRNLSEGQISHRVEFFSDIYEALDDNGGDFSDPAIENRERAIVKRLEMYKQFRALLNDERWTSILKLKELNEEAKVHAANLAASGYMAIPPPFGILAAIANIPQIVGSFDVANAQIDAFMNIFNMWRARALQIIDALIQHDWREPNYFRARDVTVERGGILKSQKQNIVFASRISDSVEMNAYMVPRVLAQSVYNFFDAGENELNPDGPVVDGNGEPQMKNVVQWVTTELPFIPNLHSHYTHQFSGYDRLTKHFLWNHAIKGYELQKFDENMELVETVSLPPTEPHIWTDVNVVYGKFYYYRVRALWDLRSIEFSPPPAPEFSGDTDNAGGSPIAEPGTKVPEIDPGPLLPGLDGLEFDVFLEPPIEIDPDAAGGPFAGGLLGEISVNIADLEAFLNGILSPGPIIIGPGVNLPQLQNFAPVTLRFPTQQTTPQQTNTGNPIYSQNPRYNLREGEAVLRQPLGQENFGVELKEIDRPEISELNEAVLRRIDTDHAEFSNEFLLSHLLNVGDIND